MSDKNKQNLEYLSSVVFDLSLISQGVIDVATHNFVSELAGLFPNDVTIVVRCGRLRKSNILDDESATVASDGTHFLTFLHTEERAHDVGFNTEVTQYTRIKRDIGNRR